MRNCLLFMFLSICFFFSLGIGNGSSEKTEIYYVHDDQIIYDDDVAMMADMYAEGFFVNDTHPLYKSVDGVLYSKDGTKLIAYPAGNNRQSYQVLNACVEIGPFAFSNSRLNFIEFPQFDLSNVKIIGEKAFLGCGELLQICLPSSIETIGEEAFGDCNEDAVIIVENNSACCCSSAIQHLHNVIRMNDYYDIMEWVGLFSRIVEYPSSISIDAHYQVIDGVLFQDDILLSYPVNRKSEEYIIPNGVTAVQANLFQNEYIQKLFIPSSCISIQSFVQSPDGQLEFIDVGTDNPEYTSIEGVLYSKDHSVLYCCPKNINLTVFCPLNEVKTIASKSFIYCSIKKLVLTESVQSIELFAFYGSLLEEVVIPETVINIEIEAFEDCGHLKHIYLKKDSYADEVFQSNSSGSFENLISIIEYL